MFAIVVISFDNHDSEVYDVAYTENQASEMLRERVERYIEVNKNNSKVDAPSLRAQYGSEGVYDENNNIDFRIVEVGKFQF